MSKTREQWRAENAARRRAEAREALAREVREMIPAPAFFDPDDARTISPEAYRAALSTLGLDPSVVAPTYTGLPARPGTPEYAFQRQSLRAVERVAAGLHRDPEVQRADRAAELAPGAIDAKTATPEEVRARYEQLGITDPQLLNGIRGGGREPQLASRTSADATHAATAQRERDRAVARHVNDAVKRGQSVDVKRLSAGEFAALMELRGAGGYNPAR